MPIALDTFRNIGADATRVKLDEAGGVIATATSPGGRAVAWLSEAFGAGKDENRAAINELVASIRSELGNAVGDAAELALQSRLREGRPLSARTVQQVIGNAESLVQGIREQRAEKLSNLDPGPQGIAHRMLAERIADGRVRPEVGAAMLMDQVQRAAAEAEVRRAVLAAETAAGPGVAPIHVDLLATDQAIDTAAARTDARLRAQAAARQQAEALFAPGPQGEPSEAMGVARQTLEGLGLPADRVLDALTPRNWKARRAPSPIASSPRATEFAAPQGRVHQCRAAPSPLSGYLDRPALGYRRLGRSLGRESPPRPRAGRPKGPRAELLGVLAGRVYSIRPFPTPRAACWPMRSCATPSAWPTRRRSGIRRCTRRPPTPSKWTRRRSARRCRRTGRESLLRLGAMLDAGEMMRLNAAGQNGDGMRWDAVHKLADLVNNRLEAIKAEHEHRRSRGVGHAAAGRPGPRRHHGRGAGQRRAEPRARRLDRGPEGARRDCATAWARRPRWRCPTAAADRPWSAATTCSG